MSASAKGTVEEHPAGSPALQGGDEVTEIDGHEVKLEHSVEIAISKMRHRPRTLKIRDIYDIAAVDARFGPVLSDNVHFLSSYKADLKARLEDIDPGYLAEELAEIKVLTGWESLPAMAFDRVCEIVDSIPEPTCTPGG